MPQTLDFRRGIIGKVVRHREVAEIFRHPIEQSGRVFVGQRRLRYPRNPDDEIPAIAGRRKEHQSAAQRRNSSRLAGSIGKMAAHAVHLIVDERLVALRARRARKRNARCGGEGAHLRLLGRAHDARGRTMVGNIGLGISRAPVVIVGLARLKERGVALVAIAETSAAAALAATIIIGDDVILAVTGVVTGADPGDGRHVGAGRTRRLRSSATSAQKAVDGAVPPIITGRRIAGVRFGRIARGRRSGAARHRQQWRRGGAQEKSPEAGEYASPRGAARERSRGIFR